MNKFGLCEIDKKKYILSNKKNVFALENLNIDFVL